MLFQIDSLRYQLDQERQNHEKELKQIKLDSQKEVAVMQDELKQLQEMVANVQFQHYFKMKGDNTILNQENIILRDMLRANQITGSTKEMELQRLRQKLHKYESHSLQIKRKQDSIELIIQHKQRDARNLSHHRNHTQPSLMDSTAETTSKIYQSKFKINQ